MKLATRLVRGSVLFAVPVMAQDTASSSADTNAEILI